MHNHYNKKFELLEDKNKNNKDNNWRKRKEMNLELADSYKRIGSKKYYRVVDCSTFLEFKYFPKTNEKKLNNANFCKVRLCPMCSWRRSLKIFGQVSKIMNVLEEEYNYRYIFLTLTVKNCFGSDLKNQIDLLMNAFNKMNQRKPFKNAVKGYFRALEVTYNKEKIITKDMFEDKNYKSYFKKLGLKVGDDNPNYDTYHPHFHLILAVNNSYFDDDKIYLSHKKWVELWKSCLRINYSPSVFVRKVDNDLKSGIAEVAKYTVKSEDIIIKDDKNRINEKQTDEVVRTLDFALASKRLISFGFVFKEIHKKLNLNDVENGDLIVTDNEEIRNDLTYILLRYNWNLGIRNYKLEEIVEGVE